MVQCMTPIACGPRLASPRTSSGNDGPSWWKLTTSPPSVRRMLVPTQTGRPGATAGRGARPRPAPVWGADLPEQQEVPPRLGQRLGRLPQVGTRVGERHGGRLVT